MEGGGHPEVLGLVVVVVMMLVLLVFGAGVGVGIFVMRSHSQQKVDACRRIPDRCSRTPSCLHSTPLPRDNDKHGDMMVAMVC